MSATPPPGSLRILGSRPTADVAVCRLDGDLDLLNLPLLRESVKEELLVGCRRLVLDLARVGFVDSAGLGGLVDLHRRARVLRSELVLWRPHEAVVRLLDLTGLAHVLMVVQDAEWEPSA